jgi:hypothetical protein
MNKFSLLVHLQAFADSNPTNNPTLNFFKWTRDISPVDADKPKSEEFCLAPGESKSLWSGERVLSADSTTQLSIQLKSGTDSTYILSWTGTGTNPVFRTIRATGHDATTQLIVSKNGPVITLTQGLGTPINTSSIVIGDVISLGAPFSDVNKGMFKVIAKTPTSISFENPIGEAQTVVLGAGFETALEVFSSSGVQVGDKIRIFGGFSSSTFGTYEITKVFGNRLEFFSSKGLASETVLTDNIAIYYMAKQFLYLESDKKISLTLNSQNAGNVEPFVCGSNVQRGVFLKKATMWSASITNDSNETACIYVASIE